MGIDTSMYANLQSPDIMGNLAKGMSMRDMIDQRKVRDQEQQRQTKAREAVTAGMQVSPDGTVNFNKDITMSQLGQAGLGPEALEFQQQQQQQEMQRSELDMKKSEMQMKKQLQDLDVTARIVGSVETPEGFQQALRDGEKFGLDVGQFKNMSFEEFMAVKPSVMGRTLTAKEKMQMQLQQDQFKAGRQDKAKEHGFKERELGIKERAAKATGSQSLFQKETEKKQAAQFVKMQDGLKKTRGALDAVREARRAHTEYSQKSLTGTGPIATAFGLTKHFSQDTEALNSKLKYVNLKNMVSTFDGMARSIDSDVERAAWDGTQPDISNDDRTNFKIMLGQESILLKDDAEARAQMDYVNRHGNLRGYESPIDGKVTSLVSPSGELKLIPKAQKETALENGFMALDEYASRAPTLGGSGLRQKQNQANQKSIRQMAQEEIQRRKAQKQNAGGGNGF